MANLKEIRRRIASVKGTQKITRAMKMVSAAKLRRAQERAENFREYSQLVTDVLVGVASDADSDAHPLLERREQKKSLLLVISGDGGLCGGFNSNLNRMVAESLRSSDIPLSIAAVGKKSKVFFEHRDVKIQKFYADVFDDLAYENAATIARELAAFYVNGKYDSISLAYNQMISVVSQVPGIVPLLPVAPPEKQEEVSKQVGPAGFVFEPAKKALLATLLPQYVEVKIFGALLESLAAEHAARMTAMETATTNAQDMIDSLTLVYNRARQTVITSELMDIVGGAEALND